ncbi:MULTISPECIES: hypothetical protein [unclassified Bradyrhizobium]|uniref:hypothetical protein n=1 Tax=unclassified Bradyrhizobium TaxID=2631580 RepID=UPI00247B0485|nr:MULTISPECIES: hypothetical protein [unclassified Bradyrhizobium]WGR72937.1 hypothetical protein MTX24_08630 [Bradyrhizobium sp. ISRA426]WGR77772.1 hypothetical protein MTX21_33585 [Bradyrhizobium sp. ISRA430]WGR88177.1 hypothetical protein MTX25_08635 [Bradyrhizobium sp. ISRA432]
MAAHSTEPAHKKESKADYVYSLHGIRTNAFWQTQLEQQIEKSTGFEAGARNYMRFSTVMFVLKIIFAAKPLRLVEGDLLDLQERYRVNVIAHSFGTWLLFNALRENNKLRVHNIIMCGSIFPRASSAWRQLKYGTGQISGNIVNFCGARDPFPALAELLSRDYGASGVVGAGDPTVEDSFHDVGHSGFLTPEFCSEYWINILASKKYTLQPAPVRRQWYIPAILWSATHRGALLVALSAIAVLGYWLNQSEYACWWRDCYVDVVRIHNFGSSTRQPGSPRRYVDQVSFEYSYNFNRSELVFRAPRDRNPVVTSLIGDNLERIKPQESVERLFTGDDTASREYLKFRLPVRDRRANFSVEFANDSSEAPDGIEVFADRTIRNLKLQIFLPDQVSLSPPKGSFRKGVLIKRQSREDVGARNCQFDVDGRSVSCTDLNIPSTSGFYYCFDVKGWSGPQDVQEVKLSECRPSGTAKK